ncbi:MAG: DUF6982 domain-containing protein [Myxococcaceae bacterium]
MTEPEGYRWHELRQILGFPPLTSEAESSAQQAGYIASDGNWYPYPLDEYGRPYDPYAGAYVAAGTEAAQPAAAATPWPSSTENLGIAGDDNWSQLDQALSQVPTEPIKQSTQPAWTQNAQQPPAAPTAPPLAAEPEPVLPAEAAVVPDIPLPPEWSESETTSVNAATADTAAAPEAPSPVPDWRAPTLEVEVADVIPLDDEAALALAPELHQAPEEVAAPIPSTPAEEPVFGAELAQAPVPLEVDFSGPVEATAVPLESAADHAYALSPTGGKAPEIGLDLPSSAEGLSDEIPMAPAVDFVPNAAPERFASETLAPEVNDLAYGAMAEPEPLVTSPVPEPSAEALSEPLAEALSEPLAETPSEPLADSREALFGSSVPEVLELEDISTGAPESVPFGASNFDAPSPAEEILQLDLVEEAPVPVEASLAPPMASVPEPLPAPTPISTPASVHTAPTIETPLAMAQVEGEHRVIIHTLEGQVKRGTLRDVNLFESAIPLELAAGDLPESIAADRIKAIFFMQPAGARPPPNTGRKVRVTFKDGRQVAGFSADVDDQQPGFFVVPADNRTNTARIFIFRSSVQTVAEG